MWGCDHHLDVRNLIALHVERPVGFDVGLDPFEHAKSPAASAVQRVDLAMLSREVCRGHATGDREPVRMIGDAAVHIASLETALHDRLERVAPVTPQGVHLEVALTRDEDGPM
jgi:hypothetical protein